MLNIPHFYMSSRLVFYLSSSRIADRLALIAAIPPIRNRISHVFTLCPYFPQKKDRIGDD
jgi:hypothetical protein